MHPRPAHPERRGHGVRISARIPRADHQFAQIHRIRHRLLPAEVPCLGTTYKSKPLPAGAREIENNDLFVVVPGGPMPEPDRNSTHLAGEYFVAAELYRRGYSVAMT